MNRIQIAICIIAILAVLSVVIIVPVVLLSKRNTEKPRSEAHFITDLSYDIEVYDDFLSAEECAELRTKGDSHMFESAVYSSETDKLDPTTRISEQCWLKNEKEIRKRIHNLIPKLSRRAHLEDLQLVKYKPGGFFTPHYDACVGSSEFCERMDMPHGPRYITVLIYLSDNKSHELAGGETVFPKINKKITPKLGRAVVFYNVDKKGSIIEQALHGGEPVISGEKWIANQWIRIW